MSLDPSDIRRQPVRRSSFWLWLASKVFVRLVLGASPPEMRAPAKPRPAASAPVVGIRKSAVCKDIRGQLRTIDLFLPADLVSELSRPLDIRFLDGDEPVTADQFGKAIRSNFKVGGGSPRFEQRCER